MENTFSVKMIFHFYHSVVKAELKRRGFPKEVAKKIEEEHVCNGHQQQNFLAGWTQTGMLTTVGQDS